MNRLVFGSRYINPIIIAAMEIPTNGRKTNVQQCKFHTIFCCCFSKKKKSDFVRKQLISASRNHDGLFTKQKAKWSISNSEQMFFLLASKKFTSFLPIYTDTNQDCNCTIARSYQEKIVQWFVCIFCLP